MKSLKTYLGIFTYLLYPSYEEIEFLVDPLQQVMLAPDKFFIY
jgi:hypothetical protein